MARTAHNKAFTLVEMLITVTILAIIGAMVVPQIGSRNDIVAAAAARVILADLTYAQNRAITTQTPHYVAFSNQTYSVQTKTGSAYTTIVNPVTHAPYTQTFGTAGDNFSNVSLGGENFAGNTRLMFDELGAPYGISGTGSTSLSANTGTILVQCGIGNARQTLTVAVQPYTGEATVQ